MRNAQLIGELVDAKNRMAAAEARALAAEAKSSAADAKALAAEAKTSAAEAKVLAADAAIAELTNALEASRAINAGLLAKPTSIARLVGEHDSSTRSATSMASASPPVAAPGKRGHKPPSPTGPRTSNVTAATQPVVRAPAPNTGPTGARKSYSEALATVPAPSPDAVEAVAPKQCDTSAPVRPAQPAPALSTAPPARATAKRARKRIRSPRPSPRGHPRPHHTTAACAPAPAKRKCRSDAPNWRARGSSEPKHEADKAGCFSSLVGLIWSVRCALAELSSTPLLSIIASKRGLQLVMDQT